MKKVFFMLFLLPVIAQASTTPEPTKTHCIFIGTNIGDHQTSGNYIIAIGNFKSDMVFKDSSVNIDNSFPYFKTPQGKALLSFIEYGYGKTSTKQFFEDLQHMIQTYYIADLETYVKAREYNKAFYVFN